jgi:hypothetical protein
VQSEQGRRLIEQYWQRVWHDRDLAAVEQFMTDPYTRHSASGTRVLSTGQLQEELSRAWELLHGAVTTVDDVAVSGDKVWARVTTTGVNLHTGERSLLTWLGIYRVENGRFAESWSASLPDVDWRGRGPG